MQAGTAVGNLASADRYHHRRDASLVADLKAMLEESIRSAHRPVSSAALLPHRTQHQHDPADAAGLTQEVFIKVFRSIRAPSTATPASAPGSAASLSAKPPTSAAGWSRHKRQEVTIDSSYDADADAEGDSLCLSATLADPGDSPTTRSRPERDPRAPRSSPHANSPGAFRTVVILREIEGFAYEEIAEILDLNLGTVKSRLTRGRTALRDLLLSQNSHSSASPLSLHASKGAVTQ